MKALDEMPVPTMGEIVKRALRNGAPAYYVDIDRAESVLNGMLGEAKEKRGNMSLRKQMWLELLDKLKKMEGGIRNGRVRRSHLAFLLKNSRASSFFISPSYGRVVYFESKRHRRGVLNVKCSM